MVGFGGLVAYDDEDAMSSVSSEPDVTTVLQNIPIPVSEPPRYEKKQQQNTTNVPSTTISEERRNQLREIELKVIKYQDELEASRRGDSSITEEAVNKVRNHAFSTWHIYRLYFND